jgi:hypothetical protein
MDHFWSKKGKVGYAELINKEKNELMRVFASFHIIFTCHLTLIFPYFLFKGGCLIKFELLPWQKMSLYCYKFLNS